MYVCIRNFVYYTSTGSGGGGVSTAVGVYTIILLSKKQRQHRCHLQRQSTVFIPGDTNYLLNNKYIINIIFNIWYLLLLIYTDKKLLQHFYCIVILILVFILFHNKLTQTCCTQLLVMLLFPLRQFFVSSFSFVYDSLLCSCMFLVKMLKDVHNYLIY